MSVIPEGLAEAVAAHTKQVDPDIARAFIDVDELKSLLYQLRRSEGLRLSPSGAAKCARRLYYELAGVPRPALSPKSMYTMGLGSAMHAWAEQLPVLWDRLPDDVKAGLTHSLMARYPDAVFEEVVKIGLTESGILWSGRIDIVSYLQRLIADFKSSGNYVTEKLVGGREGTSLDYVVQIGIGARMLERARGLERFSIGRVAYWPKEPLTTWQAESAGVPRGSYDGDDPNDFLIEFDIDLTAEPVQDAVDMAIKFAERVALIVVNRTMPPPRWKLGLPSGARINPTPHGPAGKGNIEWPDPATGHTLSAEAWFCQPRFCELRSVCLEDYECEVGLGDDLCEGNHPARARLPETPVRLATMDDLTGVTAENAKADAADQEVPA